MEEHFSTQTPPEILCGSCSATIMDSDIFCDNCGYPLKGTAAEQQMFIENRAIKEIDLDDYNKKIKHAGNALYWVAISCVITGVIVYAMSQDEATKLGLLITNLVLAMIFVALAAWSRTKPLAAILSGAALYAIIIIINLIDNPKTIAQGFIVKIIIIVAFVKGIKSAIEADKIKKEFNIR